MNNLLGYPRHRSQDPVFRLLLLEDDVDLGAALLKSLTYAGFSSVWSRRARDANERIAGQGFGLILLDIQLPDGNGLEVLRRLRERGDRTPVLLLTVRDAIDDRVRGLDAGADDYLTKPFAVPELIARIKALIRRAAGQATADWRAGELSLDPARCRASIAGRPLDLSRKEFRLLVELVRDVGNVVPRRPAWARVARST